MKKPIAWIFGGAALVGLGMMSSLSACSGDNTQTDAGGKDATANDAKNDVAQGNDSGPPDSGPADTGTGAECGSSPTLHADDAGSIYCGFGGGDAGSLYCATGTQCCLGGKLGTGYLNQDCPTWGGSCDNPAPDAGGTVPALPIQCEQNSDCTANGMANKVCCLQGATAPTQVTGCTYDKSTQGTAIVCSTPTNGACPGATDVQICSSNSDCPQGKTCTAMKWKILQLGYCK